MLGLLFLIVLGADVASKTTWHVKDDFNIDEQNLNGKFLAMQFKAELQCFRILRN